jgi:hypothetical protein
MRPIVSLTFLAATLLVVRPSVAQEAPVVAAPQPATHGTGIGIGAAGMLFNGPSGISAAFDGGPWHVDGILGLVKPASGTRATFNIGGRFWYHLHITANSDFSVGGGLGYRRIPAGAGSADVVNIEAGAQIRAFITGNVALSGTLGLSIATIDIEGYSIIGQLLAGQTLSGGAGFGLHYYFY